MRYSCSKRSSVSCLDPACACTCPLRRSLALRLRAMGKARAGRLSKVTNPSGIRIPAESSLLIDQQPGCQMSRHCQRVGASPWPGFMCQARFRRQLPRVSMMVQLAHELCHGQVSPQKILTDCSSRNVWELCRDLYDSSRQERS